MLMTEAEVLFLDTYPYAPFQLIVEYLEDRLTVLHELPKNLHTWTFIAAHALS